MGAALRTAPPERWLRSMTCAQLDAVMAIENQVYEFPWSPGNFIDSLAAGYHGLLLYDTAQSLLGYCVAMSAVDEMHLLNITVRPQAQRQGNARFMLEHLLQLASMRGERQLWLEVREGNAGALAAYLRLGFTVIGTRRGYYPAAAGRREDAIVMTLSITPVPDERHDALD